MSNFAPRLDGTMEDWLEGQLAGYKEYFTGKSLLLDVGAYQGSFARHFIDLPGTPFSEAMLFEPNGESFRALQQQFGGDKRFQVENCACDEKGGAAKLFCQGSLSTGSLLEYHPDRTSPNAQQTEQSVKVVVLDEFLAERKVQEKVGLIKIDTQGNDLRVLQGAVRTIATQRPWIIVEMISTPRFVNQARPSQITQWLEEQNYFFASQFNEMYTTGGWLAWYDACFVPREIVDTKTNKHARRRTYSAAQAEHAEQTKTFSRRLRYAFRK